jgi:hypothetical protein
MCVRDPLKRLTPQAYKVLMQFSSRSRAPKLARESDADTAKFASLGTNST